MAWEDSLVELRKGIALPTIDEVSRVYSEVMGTPDAYADMWYGFYPYRLLLGCGFDMEPEKAVRFVERLSMFQVRTLPRLF